MSAPLRALALLLGLAGAALPTLAQNRPDLHGLWWPQPVQAALVPMDGGAVPLTAEGRKRYDEAAAALKAKAGKPVGRNDIARCVPLSPTRIVGQDYPVQIVQKFDGKRDQLVLIWEHNHSYEQVYLGEKPDLARDAAYMGNSVGQYTADGISIQTTNVKEETLLDDTGLPHSEQLSLTRVLKKIDGGKTLEMITTITDPVVFSKPWRVRHTLQLRPQERIEEYTCGQGPTLETRYTRK